MFSFGRGHRRDGSPAHPWRMPVAFAGSRVLGEMREAGATVATRSVRWDRRDRMGRGVPPGVYLVALRAGAASATRHCLVLR